MQAKQLMEQFALIADAPQGIQRLREMILQLAVQGKLVPQDPTDEPAAVLLTKIQAEKERLIQAGTIKRPKPLPPIQEDEKPFELPNGWEWVRLGEIGDWGAGATPLRSKLSYYGGSIPWFKSGELTSDYIDKSEETITELALAECSLRLNKKGDVLIAMYGATIGKTSILNVDGTTNQAVCACTPFLKDITKYLLLLLKAYKPRFISLGSGGAQPNISREKIISTIACFPPLQEIPRIVAKVDALMALCDELEALQQKRAQLQLSTHHAVLESLANAQTPLDLQTAWQRLQAAMPLLFTQPQQIKGLRETILQLAVRGKLVPQDPSDEPAAVLLAKISAEKERLIKQGTIKRQKPLPPIREEEIPIELPQGWINIRFAEFAQEIFTGPFGSVLHKSDYIENGVPLINPSHMVNDRIVADFSISVSDEKADKLSSYKLSVGDIVISRRGEMGRCALVDEQADGWLCGTGSFFIRFDRRLNRRFILILFKTRLIRDYLNGNSIGTTMTNLNHGILNQMPILLPPEKEIPRILAKVDALMALCDEWEARLQAARHTQEQFALAAVALS